MELTLVFLGIFGFCGIFAQQQNQQQQQQLRPEFRQLDEPQFQPPPPLNFAQQNSNNDPQLNFETFNRFQVQQRQLHHQPQALPQVQVQQQQQPQPQPQQQFQQQQQQQQQQNFQQPIPQQRQLQQQPAVQQQQPTFQQQPQQQNFNDFSSFRGQQETLPTLPPVFIPPNNPIGPPPNPQSPIRNLFRQPESNNGGGGFSISGIISRFLNFFNFGNN